MIRTLDSFPTDVLRGGGDSRGPQDGTGNTVAQDVSGHRTHVPVLRDREKGG